VAAVDDRHAALRDAGDDLVAAAAERAADEAVEGGGVSDHVQSQGSIARRRSPAGGLV
jgi:hypothetical protein